MPKVWSRIFHLFRKGDYRKTLRGVQEMSKARDEYYKLKTDVFLCSHEGLVPAVENYVVELEAIRDKKCKWKYETIYDNNYYDTECGEAFCFSSGKVTDNKMIFCPFCGGRIEEGG